MATKEGHAEERMMPLEHSTLTQLNVKLEHNALSWRLGRYMGAGERTLTYKKAGTKYGLFSVNSLVLRGNFEIEGHVGADSWGSSLCTVISVPTTMERIWNWRWGVLNSVSHERSKEVQETEKESKWDWGKILRARKRKRR